MASQQICYCISKLDQR